MKRALRLILASSLIMGVGVWIAATYLGDRFTAANLLQRAAALGALVTAGLVVYGTCILAIGRSRAAAVALTARAMSFAI